MSEEEEEAAGVGVCITTLPLSLTHVNTHTHTPDTGPLTGAAEGGEYRNLFREMLHKSERDIDRRLAGTWNQLFAGNPANEAIYFAAGTTPDGDKVGA